MTKITNVALAALIALAPATAFAGGIESKVQSKWDKGSSETITNINKVGAYQESLNFNKNQFNAYAASQQSNSDFLDIKGQDFNASGYVAQSSSNSNQSASSDSLDASGFIVGGVLIAPPVAIAGVGGAVSVDVNSSDSSSSSNQQAAGAGLSVDGQLTITTGSTASQMGLVGAETISLNQSASELGLKTETSRSTDRNQYSSHTNISSGRSLF
jgi:hypothetical protein